MQPVKEKIIHQSFALFLTHGYKEVTLQQILNATQLSKGGFYHHFKSKEELYEAVLEFFFLSAASQKGFKPSSDANFIENMDGFIGQKEKSMELMASQSGPQFSDMNFYMFIMQAINTLPGIRQKVSIFLQEEKRELQHIIEIAKKRGEIRNDVSASEVAEHLFRLFDGTELHGIMLNELFMIHQQERKMVRQLFKWIAA